MKARIAILILTLLPTAAIFAADPAPVRTWTDSSGKYRIEARIDKFEDNVVFLTSKQTQEEIEIPLTKLSKNDQSYVQSWRKSQVTPEPDQEKIEQETIVGQSWSGAWNNNKYGTKGPLTCTIAAVEGKAWQAKFVGTGLGKPFTYKAVFSTTDKGKRTILQGVSTISGDAYRWTGYLEGEMLYGKYRSASGNNGEFRLKAAN